MILKIRIYSRRISVALRLIEQYGIETFSLKDMKAPSEEKVRTFMKRRNIPQKMYTSPITYQDFLAKRGFEEAVRGQNKRPKPPNISNKI